MTLSIRKILLINLLLIIVITSTITAIANYFLDQQDIERHLDSMLIQTTLSFQSLISDDTSARDLERIQAYLDTIPNRALALYHGIHSANIGHHYREKFQFQVWSKDNKLLLHSPNAPTEPLSDGKPGFSEKFIRHIPWRVFTTKSDESGASILVAERYDIRAALAHKIARDDIYIMLLIYPLIGLLIWVVINRGLRSLRRISDAIAHRAPSYLEPVDLEAVPVEVKPVIDELNNLLDRVKRGFDREKRFTADAAHELRTPLAALKTHAQLAQRSKSDPNRNKSIKQVLQSVDRCTHVIEQLLTLSRMHPDIVILQETAKFRMYRVAAEIIAELAGVAAQKNIEIELECLDESITIDGNATAIGILIRNLVANAINYTPEGGHVQITIKTDAKTNDVILTVADNGPGIPEELHTRVFERFFRVLGTNVQGSGLGLSIVRQIAELHSADIRLGTGLEGRGLSISCVFQQAG